MVENIEATEDYCFSRFKSFKPCTLVVVRGSIA